MAASLVAGAVQSLTVGAAGTVAPMATKVHMGALPSGQAVAGEKTGLNSLLTALM